MEIYLYSSGVILWCIECQALYLPDNQTWTRNVGEKEWRKFLKIVGALMLINKELFLGLILAVDKSEIQCRTELFVRYAMKPSS